MSIPSVDQARSAISRFDTAGALVSLEPYTAGHINHAWQARFAAEGGVAARRYLLQQINRHVFQRPDHVLLNMQRVTSHIREGLAREGIADAERRVPSLCPTREGAASHLDERGETWRLLPWIEGTRSAERATTAADAGATARAFGLFLRRLTDLPAPQLHATIPAFHDTAARVRALERVAVADPAGRVAACRAELEALLDRRPLATALGALGAAGAIAERPVHNDAKIANVLFDDVSGEALAVIDLDTTMPGLAAHDFGDLVRSSVSDSAEDERELARVAVRLEVFAALANGFLEGTGASLSAGEREQLVTGARVIVYEQAVRFLADHLDGDRYYRIARPGHNLDRARAQVALLVSIEGASRELERIVAQAAG
jgi:aminoglycoside phosphotransferase (APT) family kinase protein